MLRYPVTLSRDTNGTLLVGFPDVPEAHTFGRDDADAMRRGEDCLATAVGARIRDRRPVPPPSPLRKGQPAVTLAPLLTLKVELYQAMHDLGLRKSDLARRLKVHPPQIDRLLDLRHDSRLDQLEAALAAVGRRIVEVRVGETPAPKPRPRKRHAA